MKRLDWDTIVMRMEIRFVKFKMAFWSKLAKFAGERALDAIEDSKEIAREVANWYPELLKDYIR